jgi:hypothetical protein
MEVQSQCFPASLSVYTGNSVGELKFSDFTSLWRSSNIENTPNSELSNMVQGITEHRYKNIFRVGKVRRSLSLFY